MGARSSQNIFFDSIGSGFLEKHQKYKSLYGSEEIFHGIGIENEIYLEFEKKINVKKEFFLKNRKRERYSVDYNNSYRSDILEKCLGEYADKKINNGIELPLLLNSHSFQFGDKYGNQKTLYVKGIVDNPKFTDKLLCDLIFESNEYLNDSYNKTFTFDGDTIEFITTQFYKPTISGVIRELNETKINFLNNINTTFNDQNIFTEYGKLNIMTSNHPFAIHLTNMENYGMFNNGTIHINITLPTYLNKNGQIGNKEKFIRVHRNYIKYIQFMEPILVAIYGAPDVFSQFDNTQKDLFSASSQRCSVSRYIGLGTYDVDEMMSGKILTKRVSDIKFSKNNFWWYNKFHENSAYVTLDNIGLDINFNKHYNHGVEIRFFDHMTDIQLKEVLEFLVYLGDFILDKNNKTFVDKIYNPGYDENWNNLVEQTMRYGKYVKLHNDHVSMFRTIFKQEFKSVNIDSIYNEIKTYLKQKYQGNGKFSTFAIDKYM